MFVFLSVLALSAVDKDRCSLCQTGLGIVHDAINAGYDDKQIVDALKASCPTLPSQYVPICNAFLKNIEHILAEIRAGKDDKAICAEYSLCAQKPKVEAANGLICDLCVDLLKKVEEIMVSTKIEADVIALATKYCEKLSAPYSTLCDSLVKQYVPMIMQYLEQGLEHIEICQKISLCEASKKSRAADPVLCDLCTELVKKIEDIIDDTQVEADVEKLAKEYCDKLQSIYATLCETLVSQYVPQIMQWLDQGIEHLEICQKLHVCSSSSYKVKDTILCDLCTDLIAKIEEIIKDTKLEEDVEKLAKEYCDKLGTMYSALCEALVTQYVPQIIEWLDQGLEHAEICQKLHMCAATKVARQPENGLLCNYCVTIVQYIEKLMLDTKVESEVAKLVEKFCAAFPVFSGVCDKIVEKYVPIIMQWLEQGLEHEEICKKLGFCTNAIRASSNSFVCDLCTELVAKVEQIMVDTKLEKDVIALAQEYCEKLAVPMSTLCDSLVAQYVPQIMQWLEQGLEHLEICKKISLCPTTFELNVARIPISYENGVTCDVCKDFFKWAEDELEKYTVPYLWKLVNEKCPNVPYLRQFCKIINVQNIETFVNLLISQAPPAKCCQFLKICQ